jgi:hypothetical protein
MVRSSLTTSSIPSSFSIPVTEKLLKTNYQVWCVQVMPAIHAAHLEDLLLGIEKMLAKMIADKDGDTAMMKPNPDYFNWITWDQALLSYIFSSLTCEML